MEPVQDPSVAIPVATPIVDLTIEDLPQIESVGPLSITAVMLQDVIESLESPSLPAPEN